VLVPPFGVPFHWYANEVAPVHVPVEDVRTSPTWAVPLITGNWRFSGADADTTAAVGALVADAVPPGPVAVTVTVSVCPTSEETGV